MPILKKLRAKLKQRLTGGKKKSTSKNGNKKGTPKNGNGNKKPTTPRKKHVRKTYASTPRQRAGETWSAYQIRIGNKKAVKPLRESSDVFAMSKKIWAPWAPVM